MITRRKSQAVSVGSLQIGGDAPIVVQSMNHTDTRDAEATLRQIQRMVRAGCELTRVAVPDFEAAESLREICRNSPIPVVADIHFDYRLALQAIRNGVAKIRINPGNIGSEQNLRTVAEAAQAAGIPIRVGVNSGSLPRTILEQHGGHPTPAALAEAAERAISEMEKVGFRNLVLSLKSSDPLLTIEAYRILAPRVEYPFHIGVTEAGTLREGLIRSAVGIGTLLADGIGDTLRVSLTADPEEEVRAAWSILKSLSLRQRGPVFVSCPTCGRTQVPLERIAEEVQQRFSDLPYPIRIAVMGCVVNGPGEARDADVGIAGGKGKFLVFARGEVRETVAEDQAVTALEDLIEQEYGSWREGERS